MNRDNWQNHFYKEINESYPYAEHIPEISDSVEAFDKILDKLLATQPTDNGWGEIDKARFWIKVNQTVTCWEWDGYKNKDGYGVFKVAQKTMLAHRVAYQIVNGVIPDNLLVLHQCDNPCCVNPTHLVTGTQDDNMKDMAKKGRNKVQGKSSKYIGVGRRVECGTWRAYYYSNNTMRWIGTYKTEMEAAIARDKFVIDNGIDSKLNFPATP